MTPGTPSPSRAVLAAVRDGATLLPEIARRTGLDAGVVRLVVERLAASGEGQLPALRSGCPGSGCASCPSSLTAGGACVVPGGRTRPGPVLLNLAEPRG